jgi:proline racemase
VRSAWQGATVLPSTIALGVPGRVTAREHREDARLPAGTRRRAAVHRVTGMAHRTGEHLFSIDPHDPLVPGVVLR